MKRTTTRMKNKLNGYKNNVIALFKEIGLKSLSIQRLLSSPSKNQWICWYNDYTLVDVLKEILETPQQYIESFYDYLILCGFRKVKARFWSDLVIYDSYTYEQRVDFIIEYTCTKYKPTTNKPFLFNFEVVNTWYKHDDHNYYNAESIEHCEIVLSSLKAESKNEKFYYHCTNYRNALSIIKHGPVHDYGRKCCDFGILPSFYMTPHVHTAIEYCHYLRKLYYNEVCVVMFKLNNTKKQAYVHFPTASKKWVDLTTESRVCESIKNELDDCDFVYGPMVANINQVKHKIEKAKPHRPPKLQLASKSKESDNILAQSVHGIVWIRK